MQLTKKGNMLFFTDVDVATGTPERSEWDRERVNGIIRRERNDTHDRNWENWKKKKKKKCY
jgi:hypothetical protein